MSVQGIFRVTLPAAALLALFACSRSTPYDASSPPNVLETVRSALSKGDVKTFKKVLSTRTVDWLESEAGKGGKSVDELLNEYIASLDSDNAREPVAREKQIDENTVELYGQSGRLLGRFVREGNRWALDGFGWRRTH